MINSGTEYIETFGAVLDVKEALEHGSKSAFTRISLRTTEQVSLLNLSACP